MLAFSHNPWLVAASVAVALMAGFTGLSLLRGASALSHGQRKLVVVMASVALGGGIWSMHFVAMLGLQLPVPFYYDALITLMSALVAILMVGLALLILHFIPRSAATLTLSGAIVGAGIGVMHFIGMLGMEICQPVNGLRDYVISGLGPSCCRSWRSGWPTGRAPGATSFWERSVLPWRWWRCITLPCI